MYVLHLALKTDIISGILPLVWTSVTARDFEREVPQFRHVVDFIYIVLSPRFRQLFVERVRPAVDALTRRLEPYQRRRNVVTLLCCCRQCLVRRAGDTDSRDVTTVQFSLQVYDCPAAYPDLQSTRC